MFILKKLAIVSLIIIMTFQLGCTKNDLKIESTKNNIDTQEQQANSGDTKQYGYIYTSKSQVAFIQLTKADKQISGQLQVVQIDKSSYITKNDTHAFKGILNDREISLTFSGSIWNDSYSGTTWTGTLTGDKLSLVIPSKDGTLNTTIFNKDTVDSFNSVVLEIKQRASELKNNKDVQSANEKQLSEQQDTISKASDKLKSTYKWLKEDTGKLAEATGFNDETQRFKDVWARMQDNYQVLLDSSNVKPFTQDQLGYVHDNLGYLHDSLAYMNDCDGYLKDRIKNINERIIKVKNDIAELDKALKALSIVDKSSADKNTEVVNKLILNANIQITTSNKGIADTNKIGSGYDTKAAKLYQDAKVYVDGLVATD